MLTSVWVKCSTTKKRIREAPRLTSAKKKYWKCLPKIPRSSAGRPGLKGISVIPDIGRVDSIGVISSASVRKFHMQCSAQSKFTRGATQAPTWTPSGGKRSASERWQWWDCWKDVKLLCIYIYIYFYKSDIWLCNHESPWAVGSAM